MLSKISRRSTSAKLGEILVPRGLISESDLKEILAKQSMSNRELCELLIEKNLVTHQKLKQALFCQGVRLGEILVREKIISGPEREV